MEITNYKLDQARANSYKDGIIANRKYVLKLLTELYLEEDHSSEIPKGILMAISVIDKEFADALQENRWGENEK